MTQERLQKLFDYREDGNLVRRVKTPNRVKVAIMAREKYHGIYANHGAAI